jgi:hypothetical protein
MRDKLLYFVLGVLGTVVMYQAQRGPEPAQAQVPHNIVAYAVDPHYDGLHYAVDSNGDVWQKYSIRDGGNACGAGVWEMTFCDEPPHHVGNIWNGAPVPTSSESWGSIKSKGK